MGTIGLVFGPADQARGATMSNSALDGRGLLHGTLVGFMLCMAQPALADSQQDLQQQIKVLQEQLQSIQKQLNAQQAATKQVQAEVQATPIKQLPTGVQVVEVDPNGRIKIGPVTVQLGGYIEGAGVFRSRNENSDIGSTFGGIPFNQVPSSHETEFRQSARQTRLSLLAQSAWDENTNLSAYVESDFKGIGVTSNSGESNAYIPSLRQAYLTVDQANGWHLLAGQAWSLVTGFKDGLVPRDENLPLTVVTHEVVGFNWRRDPQVRLTKTFSPEFSMGLSVETPQASFGGDVPSNLPELVTTVPGFGSGGGTLNSGQCVNNLGTIGNCANYSVDVAPDVVLKAAFDPGWGHYEVFGLGRIFRTRTGLFAEGQKTTLTSNSLIDFGNNETVGGGVGGNLILPIMPKLLDFQASVLGGRGIGQYGAAQFADFTVNQVGDPSPIPMVQTTVGLVAHANPALDFYAYGGYERAFQDTFNLGGDQPLSTIVGYGSPLDNNTGCGIENSNKFKVPLTCSGVNKDVWELTGGFWDKVYMGKHGTVSLGLQYAYAQRELFDGVGGAPTADDNIVYASVRYYPF